MRSNAMVMRQGSQPVARWLVAAIFGLMAALMLANPARADESVLEAAMNTVLTLRSNDDKDRFLGSAFLWGDEAVVAVTNAHVVGDAEEVRLIDHAGHEQVGVVIARDPVRDVAVIAVGPGPDGKARRGLVPAADPAGLGQEVYALGAPLGVEFTLTRGLVSTIARQVDIAVPIRMVQHDAAVNPGSSGGPLVDAEGHLVGMNSQIADGSRMFVGIAYAISVLDLDRIVAGLIDETLLPVPQLDMQARPVDRKVGAMLAIPVHGMLIDGVGPGGLAEAAGLQAGDVIVAVDGTDLGDPGSLAFAIEAALPAGSARLTVLRDGQTQELTLAFAPADQAESGTLGIKLRQVDLTQPAPARIASYRLAALGVMLDDQGRITALTDNSPGLFAGLAKGDQIQAVNGHSIDVAALQALEITSAVMLLVQAPGGMTRHIVLDPWGGTEGLRPVGGANVLDPDVIVF
ncbi:MAG: trypsin-like peptidase domain-containing protein [Paracoccaceae bacterium]